ncbi:hypothetical protein Tco_0529086 [Tanacetum coccineum]
MERILILTISRGHMRPCGLSMGFGPPGLIKFQKLSKTYELDVIQPLIPTTLQTTPPNEDYVAPATKPILDKLLEDKILNVAMVDEEADPTRDLEEPERLLIEDPHFTEIQLLQDDAHRGVFSSLLATGTHFKSGLVRYHAKDDNEIFVIVDVAGRSKHEAWLRACCLLEGKQTSSGGIFDNIKYLIIFSKMQVSGKKRENWTLNKALERKEVINGYFYKRLIYKKLSAYDLELL